MRSHWLWKIKAISKAGCLRIIFVYVTKWRIQKFYRFIIDIGMDINPRIFKRYVNTKIIVWS